MNGWEYIFLGILVFGILILLANGVTVSEGKSQLEED